LVNGSPTTEGYEMQVTSQAVKIAGSGAKGVFWGTRTLLQGLVLSNQQFPASTILDQPDWKTRGAMLGKAQFLTRGFIYGLTHRTQTLVGNGIRSIFSRRFARMRRGSR
jgi:hypothetical protein